MAESAVAAFVGTEFELLAGRGGNSGPPPRKAPWEEIAFQYGGRKWFTIVAEHVKTFSCALAPAGNQRAAIWALGVHLDGRAWCVFEAWNYKHQPHVKELCDVAQEMLEIAGQDTGAACGIGPLKPRDPKHVG